MKYSYGISRDRVAKLFRTNRTVSRLLRSSRPEGLEIKLVSLWVICGLVCTGISSAIAKFCDRKFTIDMLDLDMRILGLDVCKNRVVGWLLEDWTPSLKEYWNLRRKERTMELDDPLVFPYTPAGMEKLVALNPEAVAMEPTGVHYSKLPATVCQKEGIEVLWVGHQEVKNYRVSNRLPNKNDLADALALASYAHLHYGKREFFLTPVPAEASRLREIYLELNSLNRIQSPIINRLRQQLAHEFPEAALKQTEIAPDGVAPLWAWLAGLERPTMKRNYYYDRLYEKSVARKYGIKISYFTRQLAVNLCDLHLHEKGLLTELGEHLGSPIFKEYIRVFSRFAITGRLAGLLLSQIFPIENFPALGGFKKRLGFGQVEKSSGDVKRENTAGSSTMCRTAMFLWVNHAIAPEKSQINSPELKRISDYYDKKKAKFSEDPDAWRKYLADKKIKAAVETFTSSFRENVLPHIESTKAPLVEMQLKLTSELLIGSFAEQPILPLKKAEVVKGFGVLIHNQTAAYACKVLYHELRKIK